MDLWYKCWHSEWRNAIATILCFGIVLTEVELITLLKRRNIVSVVASRKLVRIDIELHAEIRALC